MDKRKHTDNAVNALLDFKKNKQDEQDYEDSSDPFDVQSDGEDVYSDYVDDETNFEEYMMPSLPEEGLVYQGKNITKHHTVVLLVQF